MSDDPTNDLEGIFSTEKGWTQPKPAEGRQDASVVKRGVDGEERVLKKVGDDGAQGDAAGTGAAGASGHADDGGGREGEPPAGDAESVGESEASAEHQPAEEPKSEAQPADLTPPEVNLEPPAIGGGKKKSSGGGSRKRSSGGRGKKKQEQSVAKKDEGRNPSTSYYGMPFDKLKELEGQYSALAVQIRRRSPTGQWASIKGLSRCLMPPKAIFDILRPVERYTGGGTFIFDVMDPHTRDLLVRFQESITGNPKPEPDNHTIGYVEERDSLDIVPDNPAAPTPAAGYQDPSYGAANMGIFGQGGIPMGGPHPLSAQGGAPGAQQAPAFPQPRVNPYTGKVEAPPAWLAEQLPGYMKGYNAEAQWNYLREKYQQDHGHPPNQGGATDIAMYYGQQRDRDLTTVMAEKSRLEEKVNGLQQQFQEQLEREREARYKAEAEAERLKSENKYSALEAKLAALEQAPKEKSGWDPEVTKALVGLGSSVLPALLQAWGNSSKAQKDQLVEMLKATQKSGGFEDMLKTVLPAALPLIQEKMQQNSPQAKAEIEMARNDTAMAVLKQTFDMKMAEAEAEGNHPWWLPMVQQAIDSLTGGASEMMQAKQQQMAAAGGRALPQGPQGQQAQAQQGGEPQAQQGQTLDPTARMWQSMLEQDETATKATQLVWQHLPANEGWHTHEWARLIFYMHAKVDPADLADLFADHLEHCRDFEILPPAIASVFDNPEQEVRKIVTQLPIAQGLPQMAPVKYEADPEYAEAVIARTTDELSLRERERRKVEEEEAEEQSADGANGASGETIHDYVDTQGEEAQPAPVRSFTKPGGAE